ncbi:MAG: SurA N-terminal domain-containing protein [Flavobacteriales bacterium]|jgi:peptidyl-prolyl cis-trans isomerase D|uniref:SurA N-terminal domain-containing protein n=1 Tax=Blattabacterium sp. (Mastotermes darwiniensis) TaxID=39768 RepID=UPI000231DEF1|nr:SurA N-terminal domain-containing protein [Blattabacterium sp. (Mastotermes darwiniensis)]AER40805.1 peptidylprolyl cis-trans isomerase [Blattabacterium sp. (Mastotermes darwiniensis) str. MADAR]MDR1804652.1 SurA N-terminal domain-containing protein [Flavobacteriales bacterium]
MSLLEKIRRNTWFLFLFIGIVFISFVLDPNILFKFFTRNTNIIGKLNGENILIKEYEDCFQFLKKFRQEDPYYYLKNEAWRLLIHERILNQQAIKLGIQTTKQDFWNAVSKQSIYSYIPFFQDKNGIFDIRKFKLYLNNLENSSNRDNYKIEEEKRIWDYERNNIPKRILAKKYVEMLMYGLNTSLIEAELNYKDKNFFSIVDYVFIPYSEIEHKYNTIKNYEIKNYIKQHKFLYKKENLRSLSFVIFPSEPSLEDEKNMKNKMEKLFYKLKYTNQNANFVSNQSEQPFDSNFYLKKNLPPILKNFVVQNDKIGSMFGPIKRGSIYVLAKIIGKKMISDSVLSSHILISHEEAIRSSNKRTKKEAEKIAKNIYNLVKKNPKKFDFLVKEKSDDVINAKKNKGSLGWLKYDGQNVNVFGKFNIFNSENKKGMIGFSKTEFGYHIIRIDDKSIPKPAYQFAVVIKTIIPSKKTKDILYKNVNKFFIENKNSSLNTLINNARKKRYETIYFKNVRYNQWEIDGLNTEIDKKIIDWSFENNRKEGDTKIMKTSNKDYILVYLSKIRKKGFPVEEIKNNLISFIRRKKIENFFYNFYNMEKKKNLEYIAFYFYKKIKKYYKINFYDSIINNFKEPKVVGFASSLKLYETSKPILGENGIFFIKPLKHSYTSNNPSYFSYEIEILNASLRKKILEILEKVLMDKSKIEDYRKNF